MYTILCIFLRLIPSDITGKDKKKEKTRSVSLSRFHSEQCVLKIVAIHIAIPTSTDIGKIFCSDRHVCFQITETAFNGLFRP